MKIIEIDGVEIKNEKSFHKLFAETLGFPRFYGNNMDVWVDCMSYLNCPQEEMSTIHTEFGEQLWIKVKNADIFKRNCPDLWLKFLECIAFVNWRCPEDVQAPLLILSADV